jgi:hypothetical protein
MNLIKSIEPKLLFLDDVRIPYNCTSYMYLRMSNISIYHKEWNIVRSYQDFVNWIEENGLPDVISFDYDLADDYSLRESLPFESWFNIKENRVWNGLDCAKFLLNYCKKNNLNLPRCLIHSANPFGTEEIKKIIN